MTRPLRPAVAVALLACAGCGVRRPGRQSYRLVQPGPRPVLIPPGVAQAGLVRRTFTADVAAGRAACPPGEGGIRVQARGKRLRVTVSREMLTRQPPGWLSAWTAQLEAQDCLAPGEGLRLAGRIAEALPLELNVAFHLLHASHQRTGQVDLGPQTRLQVVSPILREGAPPGAPVLEAAETSAKGNTLTVTAKSNLAGYETAWYAVQPKPGGVGFAIVPLYAERHVQGETERRPAPATNYFLFPGDAAFYRLFYKADQTDFTALAVAARSRAELEARSRTLETGAASCEKLHRELCVAIPRRVAVNPLVAITVNGSELLVNWGATLGEAIRKAGERQPGAVLPRLAVCKLYQGRPAQVEFDRASPAILNLILAGGEVISWK